MQISATEFRTNVGKYLEIALIEDIYIMKHGKPSVIVSANKNARQRVFDSLIGMGGKLDKDPEDILMERLDDYKALN